MSNTPSIDYINYICSLYNDVYDDRIEDTKPGGLDWIPGAPAEHKSLAAFQKELAEQGIKLSRSKLQKILISGGCWSTERSRKVQELYAKYIRKMKPEDAVRKIAAELEISTVSVNINLPYEKVVYYLENKSGNAKRIGRWRAKQRE